MKYTPAAWRLVTITVLIVYRFFRSTDHQARSALFVQAHEFPPNRGSLFPSTALEEPVVLAYVFICDVGFPRARFGGLDSANDREDVLWRNTHRTGEVCLTHWGRVTHICVSKLTIIGSDNGLAPGRRQAIIWTNARMLLIGPLGTNFGEVLIEIHKFPFKNMHLKISSAKLRPFGLDLNVF